MMHHIPITHIHSRSTVLVVLGMSGSRRLNYEPGDHVGIFPRNHSKNVSNLLDRLNPSINPDEPIYIESRRKSTAGENWVEERRMPVPVTLREALTYYLDIANPPSAQFLKLLAKQATRKTDIEDLNELAKGGDMYEDWKHERFPGLCDVMDQFASLKVDVSLLLQQLPLLQCVSGLLLSYTHMHTHAHTHTHTHTYAHTHVHAFTHTHTHTHTHTALLFHQLLTQGASG